MTEVDILFFELIRVAIGTHDKLSHIPKAKEWEQLYDMAKKQSLVGICFAGVQKLCSSETEEYFGMNKFQYLTWMGMAAKIQQRNQIVDEQCVALQKRLSAEECRSCILKGQGVAQLYDTPLRSLRQSGDIDIWIEGGIEKSVALTETLGEKADVTEQHVHFNLFDGIDVEAHFTPSMLRDPLANTRLQRWFKDQEPQQFLNKNEHGLCVPTTEFNLVYLLIHIYRHLFGAGVGLRQVMDYYFTLIVAKNSIDSTKFQKISDTLRSLGLLNFAGALMYVMRKVFEMDRSLMLCEQNEKHGKFLLNEIVIAGNMGHHDERLKEAKKGTRWQRFYMVTKHNMRLFNYYPEETLWAPFSRVKIWAWRKWNRWI